MDKKEQALLYNKAIRESYISDPDRIDEEHQIKRARRADSMGYYARKFIVGYMWGYLLGVLLGIWFVYKFLFEPFLIPLYQAFMGIK